MKSRVGFTCILSRRVSGTHSRIFLIMKSDLRTMRVVNKRILTSTEG